MKPFPALALIASAAATLAGTAGCSDQGSSVFRDVSEARLPTGAVSGFSMDAAPADIDNDGDTDILIAHEYKPNILLINDGSGTFSDESAERLPQVDRDSEDIAVADFDRDGDLDVVVVSEDDRVNEYYRNGPDQGAEPQAPRSGIGFFSDASESIPVAGRSNAVVTAELTGDDYADLIIGNNGRNRFLANDGLGGFVDETAERLPGVSPDGGGPSASEAESRPSGDRTQDLELADVDGDGDLDLVVGNEDRNRLLINDGTGVFSDETAKRLVFRDEPEETREADFGDIDGDGDPDLFFANVRAFVRGANPRNRLLLNDGTGHFTDVSDRYLAAAESPRSPAARPSFDADFIDINADGAPDLVTADTEEGWRSPARARVLINTSAEDGNAALEGVRRFVDETERFFPTTARGNGFDVEAADLDGDGTQEIYLANRAGGSDRLLKRGNVSD